MLLIRTVAATGIAAITALEMISLGKDQIKTLVIIVLARRGFRG
jgi:hypothetical protein